MKKQPFNIPIDEPKKEFEKHLAPDYNKRIIFSAPFGTGKTYFLKKFFDERETEWKVIRLFPVNYSVSSNEDVFELIKFDILLQLLEDDDLKFESYDFNFLTKTEYYFYYNSDTFLKFLLASIGPLGKSLDKSSTALKKLHEKYSEFIKKISEDTDKRTALNFIDERTKTKGSAYENDLVTQLIISLIERISNKPPHSVLIIDDLDRIDPEHIFRLLNVFAAHFDIGAPDTNKFGFDKVIFVCDINNIRNIFHAKYGTDTDFTGYIDKFYSTDIFTFINYNAILDFIEDIINSKGNQHVIEKEIVGDGIFTRFSSLITTQLYRTGNLNLRAVEKLYTQPLLSPKYRLNFKVNQETVYSHNSMIISLFEFLKAIYGNYNSTLTAISKAAKQANPNAIGDSHFYYDKNIISQFYPHCLPILTAGHQFRTTEKTDGLSYEIPELEVTLTMNYETISKRHICDLIYFPAYEAPIAGSKESSRNYLKLLEITFEKLQSFGHLKD